jgi:hypothetical protein
METISWRDLAAADVPVEAFRRWFNMYGGDDIPIDDAYNWLNIQADCYMRWVKANKSGKVPQEWIDYIAEQEKPKRTVEEIVKWGKRYAGEFNVAENSYKPDMCSHALRRNAGWFAKVNGKEKADYLALAANNFADDRKAMEEAVKQLKESCLDPIGAKALYILMDRLTAHDKQAAEMGD